MIPVPHDRMGRIRENIEGKHPSVFDMPIRIEPIYLTTKQECYLSRPDRKCSSGPCRNEFIHAFGRRRLREDLMWHRCCLIECDEIRGRFALHFVDSVFYEYGHTATKNALYFKPRGCIFSNTPGSTTSSAVTSFKKDKSSFFDAVVHGDTAQTLTAEPLGISLLLTIIRSPTVAEPGKPKVDPAKSQNWANDDRGPSQPGVNTVEVETVTSEGQPKPSK
jgi:hypothetical protein